MSHKTVIIIGIFVLTILFIEPKAVLGDWKVYYTGKAAKMFGSYGRGSFATKGQCDSYRISRPGFEANNSYCSGFDALSSSPPKQGQSGSGNANAAQGQAVKQPQQEQAEAQESRFSKDKEQLLGTIRIPASSDGLRPGGTSFFGLGGGGGSPEIRTELDEFEKTNEQWVKKQRQLIEQRLKEPNKWSNSIYRSLKSKAPPLPYKTFDELEPGDTLLIEGAKVISVPDQALSGQKVNLTGPPEASHTVLYLKEINGKKLFLDNQPGEGPRIVPEEYLRNKYGSRGIEVARLAQPLNKEEADRLYGAAKEMRSDNVEKTEAGKGFDKTNYGLWGKENVVCSEADWALIRASGRDIPQSDDWLKKYVGIVFSPQDFYNRRYFLVSPLSLTRKPGATVDR